MDRAQRLEPILQAGDNSQLQEAVDNIYHQMNAVPIPIASGGQKMWGGHTFAVEGDTVVVVEGD